MQKTVFLLLALVGSALAQTGNATTGVVNGTTGEPVTTTGEPATTTGTAATTASSSSSEAAALNDGDISLIVVGSIMGCMLLVIIGVGLWRREQERNYQRV